MNGHTTALRARGDLRPRRASSYLHEAFTNVCDFRASPIEGEQSAFNKTGWPIMSRIHQSAREAAGINSLEDDEGDDAPRKLPEAGTINKTLVELANIARDRKALAEREREVKKGFVNEGGSKLALGFIRRLEGMDPDERSALLHEIDAYAAFKSYW